MEGGLHDKRMGVTVTDNATCMTCEENYERCPGHYGHIELVDVLYNPLTFYLMVKFLRVCCLHCNILMKITKESKNELIKRFLEDEIFRQKMMTDIKIFNELLLEYFERKCLECDKKYSPYRFTTDNKIFHKNSFVRAETFRVILKRIFEDNLEITKLFFKENSYKMIFIERISVIPNRFRTLNTLGAAIFESYHNVHLINIIKYIIVYEKTISKLNYKTKEEIIYTPEILSIILNLQTSVKYYYSSNSTNSHGVKQFLEKKDGLLRQNMMGKRVNYSARSVIVPDTDIKTDEVGIAKIFAEKMTFPERVNAHNFNYLRSLVIRGCEYPGANILEFDDMKINLKYVSIPKRRIYANQLLKGTKIVHRHIIDGDIVLVNRQPTLQKASMMSHRVKVLDGNVIRLHYANCSSYNADFDGDEMNIHFPQTYNSKAEAESLSITHENFFNTNFQPLRGLIQDHVLMAAILSSNCTFLERDEYIKIISKCEYKERINSETPSILRPFRLYSGKQIITTIFRNLNVRFNLKKENLLVKYLKKSPKEGIIYISDGEYIHGFLDKSLIGGSRNSIAHIIGELYGFKKSDEFLTMLSRVLNEFLKLCGFSISVSDLELSEISETERSEILQSNLKETDQYIKLIKERCTKEEIEDKILYSKIEDSDGTLKNKINSISTEILGKTLITGNTVPGMENMFNFIVLTGAKGSIVNISQISGLLGQQELEGKRVSLMTNGQTLPTLHGIGPQERGFISGRFLSGISQSDFYFHCMAGREGLMATSVKTSTSGYLQRCLIKGLENIISCYDGTVREYKRIIQFEYSQEGFFRDFYDVSQFKSLSEKEIEINRNKFILVPGEQVGVIAAQSVGEPSTQMTLNTFHHAGVGAKNVVLGVPRLFELFIGGYKTKTEIGDIETEIDYSNIFKPLIRKTLKDITQNVTIIESDISNGTKYKITFNFSIKVSLAEHKKIKNIFIRYLNKIANVEEKEESLLINAQTKDSR